MSMTLADWREELADLDVRERMEAIVEFANQLPPVRADRREAPFPESCRVQECQTAVHLWVETHEGRVRLEADVPKNSPLVRGMVAVLVTALDGATLEDIRQLPLDIPGYLHLDEVLGMTRRQGVRGVMQRIRHAAATG